MINKSVQQQITNILEITKKSYSFQIECFHLLIIVLFISQFGATVEANSNELLDDNVLPQNYDGTQNDGLTSQLISEIKRSWKNLQGSWGKRGDKDHSSDEYNPQLTDLSSDYSENPGMMRYSVIYSSSPIEQKPSAVAASYDYPKNEGSTESELPSSFEKKNWKNMNVAWGKRRSVVWNKFKGAWGKREPGWNNLKGMWGKRSPKDWKKLQSAWGKRNIQLSY